MVSMLMDESNDNRDPTIVQQMHNDQLNVTIYYNPNLLETIKDIIKIELNFISQNFNLMVAHTEGVLIL